ncbi:MAG: PD-(D/E)XK nuclease family protein [Chloroflexota bacterium]|nr:PD-(D/E)XK nuclease family protein [Chloroflexota bacterium]MBI5702838.1 PD-(D/E)XK nuclease family protein [Chloroflexota bacterium]
MPLTTLSQSSLQDYVDCPRRFQLRYLERLSYPAVEMEPALENEKHLQEGEYFHRLAHQYLIGVPVEKIARLANTVNLQRWWENFLADKDFQGLRDLGSLALHPEASLSAPLGNYRLVAKYDLLAIENGKAIIYDWKTYRKRPRSEWLAARMQTRVYRALLVHAGAHLNKGQPFAPEQVEMVYWFAEYPNDPARFTYTSAQYKRDWDSLVKLADEIAAASSYPLTDDRTKCLYCPYRSYCDRGVQAGEAEQAEAEMEAEEWFDVNFEQIGEIAF